MQAKSQYGLTFPLSGTAMVDGDGMTDHYGSLFFAYDNNHAIYFWKPTSSHGCDIMIGGKWSDNILDGNTECSASPDIYVRYMKAVIDGGF